MNTMNCIRIVQVEERTESLIAKLVRVWEASVKATHSFLSGNEIANIKKCIPKALHDCNFLAIVQQKDNNPIAFMGIEKQRLEMLFVEPKHQNKGIGRKLVQFGIENYSLNELTVNEQNLAAKTFYKKLGFIIYKRSNFDEQGRPYPLLYMRK